MIGRGSLLFACALAAWQATPVLDVWHARRVEGTSGTIAGVVYDSLVSNAPLAGAEVTVEGTALSAVSDREGRFRIAEVAAGRAVLRFYHARLDSLGFGAAPAAVTVTEATTAQVRLTTPSPATFRAGLCPGTAPASTGVLVGIVRNVDTRAPMPNASVEVRWTEWVAGANGLVRSENGGAATANANGVYAACGVPTDVPVAARASADGHVTGLVEVDLAGRLFAVRDFGVSVADPGTSITELARLNRAGLRGDSARAAGSASLRGVVRDAAGAVVNGAQAALSGFPDGARTGGEGTFTLAPLPAGTQSIELRALGHVPKRLTLDLTTGDRREIEVVLERGNGQALAPVNIVGRGTSFDRTGFAARMKAGVGEFITQEQIERRRAFDAAHLLWFVRGVKHVGGGIVFPRPVGLGIAQTGGALLSGKGIPTVCAPAYWVDGFFVGTAADDVNNVVKPRDIRGIEVYVDPATAPALYRRPDIPCGIVLIWTKPPTPKPQR